MPRTGTGLNGLDRGADPGELLGDTPQTAGEIRVLRGGGTGDELGCAAHVREMAGPGEAVARNVGDGGVQDRQCAVVALFTRDQAAGDIALGIRNV